MSGTTTGDGKRESLPATSTTKLILETSTPTSASPYPSPSSAFYPPPIPANHEFANILAANKRYRGATPMDGSTSIASRLGSPAAPSSKVSSPVKDPAKLDSSTGPRSLNGSRRVSQEVSATSPATEQSKAKANGVGLTPQKPAPSPSPTALNDASKPTEIALDVSGPVKENGLSDDDRKYAKDGLNSPSQDVTTPLAVSDPNTNTLLLSSSHLDEANATYLTPDSPSASQRNSLTPSLTASRPAPPSPGPSRRASLVRRGSSRRSTYSNTSGPSRRHSTLSTSFTWADVHPLVEGVATGGRGTPEVGWVGKPIIVRDFAYPEDDERFSQRPVESLPYAERPVSQDHDRSDEEEYEEDSWDDNDDGYGLIASRYRQIQSAGDEDGRTPLPEVHQKSSYEDSGLGQEYEEGEESTELDPNAPLRPGIYRALFAFEAEGTAEMSLYEGQLVRLIGRGGGVGWAVVERNWQWEPEETGSGSTLTGQSGASTQEGDSNDARGNDALGEAGQALVPESYLEIFRLDPE